MVDQLLMGFGLVLLFTPALIFLAILFNKFDHPNERRINTIPIPTAGGVAIYLAFFLLRISSTTEVCPVFCRWHNYSGYRTY